MYMFDEDATRCVRGNKRYLLQRIDGLMRDKLHAVEKNLQREKESLKTQAVDAFIEEHHEKIDKINNLIRELKALTETEECIKARLYVARGSEGVSISSALDISAWGHPKLRETKERLHTMADSILDKVLLHDTNGLADILTEVRNELDKL